MTPPTQLVGQSSVFLDAIDRAEAAAVLDRPVLVIGERGTGKELIAERLHRASPRWDGPLVTMNCAALPDNLIDAELFGHEAGSFTGATRSRAGRFEEADGGTLFLDEIGTLAKPAQDRLLRVVEYGELTRIGSNKPIHIDVRLVGATNVDLPKCVEAGSFRADLLDRLSFEVITLPPLRARGEDILGLAEYFGRKMAAELGWDGFPGFDAAVSVAMVRYRWPGNVRELRNVVERTVYRWADPATPIGAMQFDPFDSPWRPGQTPVDESAAIAAIEPEPEPGNFRDSVSSYERGLLERALTHHRHNQRATAAALGLTYDQLRHCLRRHGLLAAA
jgi:psp operon transcriptional activator